jgi:hypothetical protein
MFRVSAKVRQSRWVEGDTTVKYLKLAAIALLAAIVAVPASAQWLLSKKAKVNPIQRVPELILIVKTEGDERKRAHAAEELREYDTRAWRGFAPLPRLRAKPWRRQPRPMTRCASVCTRRRRCRSIIWRVTRRSRTRRR